MMRHTPPPHSLLYIMALALALFFSACRPALLNPPRLATQEARAAGTRPPTPSPLSLPAPTPTGNPISNPPRPAPAVTPNPTLTLWVNETSEAHKAALEEMAAEFRTRHDIHLEFVLVDDKRLPKLVETAVLSDTLPDLILHPIEYSVGWAERGILDAEAATQAVDQIGRETFDADALRLVEGNGRVAALPSDGWQQILVYRADWFETLNLDPPQQYDDMLAAAEAIYRSETLSAQTGITTSLLSGLVVPTESDLVSTQHVFEQIATANGCQLVDAKGEVTFLHPNCLDALDFYRDIVNRYSPSDVQTDVSALNAYVSGRTGMIFARPGVLPALAGLDPNFPLRCPECGADGNYLVENSGIITEISGRSSAATPASFGQLTYLGITGRADRARALAFADYWFNAGYLKWLAVEPERKVPLRPGAPENPTQFIEAWRDLPISAGGRPLRTLFGEEIATALTRDIAASPRWGFLQGQGKLVTDIYQDLTFSIVLQEMLSGYFTSSQAVIEAYERVVDLIPNYAYYIEPEAAVSPTAQPEE